MSPVHRLGPSCICGCGRPAREAGGYATACWMGLTPLERATELWAAEDRQPTVPIPSQEIAEVCALEDLLALPDGEPAELDLSGLLGEIESLPTYEGERRWAA